MSTGSDIYAKITSYYNLDGNLTDAKGINTLVTGVSATYEAGKNSMNRLVANSRGAVALATPIPITSTTQRAFIGGWIYYTGSTPSRAEFSLGKDFNSTNEMLVIDASGGSLVCYGWQAGGFTYYSATNPNVAGLAYPITVRVQDSIGQTASSLQQIIIRDPANPFATGWYFVVGQWNQGVPSIYVNSVLVNTGAAAASVRGPNMNYFQIGNQFGPVGSSAALQYVFFGSGQNLTQGDIDWIYNAGNGRQATDFV